MDDAVSFTTRATQVLRFLNAAVVLWQEYCWKEILVDKLHGKFNY
jgi:hypothetical protein